MKTKFLPLPKRFSNIAIRALAFPVVIAMLIILGILLISSLFPTQTKTVQTTTLQIITLAGGAYILLLFLSLVKYSDILAKSKWVIVICHGLMVSIMTGFLPPNLLPVSHIIALMGVMLTAIIFDRSATYLVILFYLASQLFTNGVRLAHFALPSFAVVITETIIRLLELNHRQITRLETINEFSQQISASLDIDQLIPLLNEAIKNAIQADTYYVGILEGDNIKLDLFYDDGEYFYDVIVPLEGSLAGWIARNNSPLFLPDLRKDTHIEGVKKVIIGKDKTSLSWMGVPLTVGKILGVMAVASYTPNAFDRSDMELLENLAQNAALILHNAFHHARVEEQSQLDSLTGAYNHGYFLKELDKNAQQAIAGASSLALIMLDVDYFKQYNDSYGHLAGDEMLIQLTRAIRQHIKRTDAVGRWGGEEFAICLPNANGMQAHQVALRIQETMGKVTIRVPGKEVPSPTLSQGIAVFPNEADEIFHLVDLADKRLYKAKERGRNQIEPEIYHWK